MQGVCHVNMKSDSEGVRCMCTSQGTPVLASQPGVWHGRVFVISSEGTSPVDTLILKFQPPGEGHDIFLLLKPPSVWHFVLAGLENEHSLWD